METREKLQAEVGAAGLLDGSTQYSKPNGRGCVSISISYPKKMSKDAHTLTHQRYETPLRSLVTCHSAPPPNSIQSAAPNSLYVFGLVSLES